MPDPAADLVHEHARRHPHPEREILELATVGAVRVLGPDHGVTKALAKASTTMDKVDLWHARLAVKMLRRGQREAISAALGGLATGDVQGGAAGVLTTLVAPRVAARLITSPRFVKWLLTPVTSANGIGAHLGRLVGIAEAEPELREEIAQYMAAMRPVEKVAGPPIPFRSAVPVQ